MTAAQRALKEGVQFLARQQLPDGGFRSLSTPDLDFRKPREYKTMFATALILSCLNSLKSTDPVLERVKRRAAHFLLRQKSPHWSWNYWPRNSPEAKRLPYPDDLDDTFCALTALYEYDRTLIDGAALAKIVTLLTLVEEKEGGPYRTWLVPKTADPVWKDVDIAVNSNIAHFLSLQEIELPNVVRLVERAIERRKFVSPYYPSFYPLVYFMARWYRGGQTRRLIDFLSAKQNRGHWGNSLHTALSLSSLLRLGVPREKLRKPLHYLLRQQRQGSWPAAAFCFDPAIGGTSHLSGSRALTTAFALEALAESESIPASLPARASDSRAAKEAHQRVVKFVQKRVSRDQLLKSHMVTMLQKVLRFDKKKQIVLLPFYFREALGPRSRKIPDDLVVRLGAATLFGWIAYTIYDDFLDGEGDPKLLPAANIALRELTVLFREAVPKSKDFHELFTRIMDAIEAANAWEVERSRLTITKGRVRISPRTLPNYGDLSQLYKKSFGHALGPLAILFSLGHSERSREVRETISYFRHYLLARQLNDDAHDWEEDLRAGRINAVGALLLRQVGRRKVRQPIEAVIERCRKIFWEEIIVEVGQRILAETQLAREALTGNPAIEDSDLLASFLVPIEQAANKAIDEHRETKKFLTAYGTTRRA